MKKFALVLLAVVMAGIASAQIIAGGPVDYRVGNTECQGYVAYDSMSSKKRPGVLIIHDWNSIDDYEISRANQLAKMGYVAMVADIYGKNVRPKNTNESGAQAGSYKNNRALFRERLIGALELLKKDPNVDPTRIVAIGYCFGGTGVLELARMGADLRGVVSFHGGLDAAEGMTAGPVIPQVLVLHGADDPFVPKEQVEAFKKEFGDAGAKMEFVSYPGAVHSFTNPNAGNNKASGSAYHKPSDDASWAKMKQFFDAVLK